MEKIIEKIQEIKKENLEEVKGLQSSITSLSLLLYDVKNKLELELKNLKFWQVKRAKEIKGDLHKIDIANIIIDHFSITMIKETPGYDYVAVPPFEK